MLTAYDATLAGAADRAGVDVLLVGDSLGMVVQGHASTLAGEPRRRAVSHPLRRARRGPARSSIADLPFGTYQAGAADRRMRHRPRRSRPARRWSSSKAARGSRRPSRSSRERGIPVCGHVGLQPQFGQHARRLSRPGQDRPAAADCACSRTARASPRRAPRCSSSNACRASLGEALTRAVGIPVIGIGAGPACSGQVLVIYDALGVTAGRRGALRAQLHGRPRQHRSARLRRYVAAVKDGSFPAPEHCF